MYYYLVSVLLFFKNMVVNHPHSQYSKYEIHFTPGAKKIGSQWLVAQGGDLCDIDGKTV